ncbi:hypothetical protein MKFW12EY_09420 [Methylomonas koyamae]|nr:hypothetical protein MKFW12EY_09420 [Methylomonas koyamae]
MPDLSIMFNTSAIQYPKSKLSILALLALNAVIYGFTDTLTSFSDALVWVVLLVIYELEANKVGLPLGETAMRHLRSGLIGVIGLVFASYWRDSEWLDVANSLLWFGLIAILETEVRWPDYVRRHPRFFWLATIATFTGLLAMAGVWLARGAWLDGYDALLWIVAFGFIEVDIFHLLKRKRSV